MPTLSASLPRPRTAREVQRVIELDRRGEPYLLFRDENGTQLDVVLTPTAQVTIGRDATRDVALRWDGRVSRYHAELACRGERWVLTDDGISTNGTYVNGERVQTRRALRNGDLLQVGSTSLLFRLPAEATEQSGTVPADAPEQVAVTPAQLRVLRELCRPFAVNPVGAFAPTNAEIAAALVVSERAVKSQMRMLFQRFGIERMPQNAKRARLAELALAAGVVDARSLADD